MSDTKLGYNFFLPCEGNKITCEVKCMGVSCWRTMSSHKLKLETGGVGQMGAQFMLVYASPLKS